MTIVDVEASVVGDGTPSSCTISSLSNAISLQGQVSFNCGSSPHTFNFTNPINVTGVTTIDGGNNIIFDGGNQSQIFVGQSLKKLTVKNATFQNGFASDGRGGAIETKFRQELEVENSKFLNNKANTKNL
jgi:hypothetical protein